MKKKTKVFTGVFEWPDDGQMLHKFPQMVRVPDWETGEPRYGDLYLKSDLQYAYEMDRARAANKGRKFTSPTGEQIPLEEITVQRIEFRENGNKYNDPVAPLYAKTMVNGIEVYLVDVAYFEGIVTYADGTKKTCVLVPFSEEPPWKALKNLPEILNSGVFQAEDLPEIVDIKPKG